MFAFNRWDSGYEDYYLIGGDAVWSSKKFTWVSEEPAILIHDN